MSKHTYHARFTIVDEHRVFDKNYQLYEVDFLEIEDLKIKDLYGDGVFYEAKIELMRYIYKLIKNRKNIPNSISIDILDVSLDKNQFIKKIEVDTDVILEVFDNKHDRMFSEVSCFRTCEGICRRVLNDIKKEYGDMSMDALKIYYEEDKVKRGSSFKNIIKLGELLKLLEEDNFKLIFIIIRSPTNVSDLIIINISLKEIFYGIPCIFGK